MRLLILLFFAVTLYGDIIKYQYYKDINNTYTKTKFVKIKLDKELYKYSQENFKDIRIYEEEKEQGFIIQKEQQSIVNNLRLRPNSYNRDESSITFILDKPFDIEEIILNITDRNFKTEFDLYINDNLIQQDSQIYDYSRETGNQNFTIKTEIKDAREITLTYDLSKTHFFYKKYKEIEKLAQHLTLKSIILKNNNKTKTTYEVSYINPLNISTENRVSTYIFDTQSLPIDMLEIFSKTKYFQRVAEFHISEDAKIWSKIGKYKLYKNLDSDKKQRLKPNLRAKYLKIVIQNEDNQPIDISALKIGTIPSYLYFIPEFNKKYRLYFGNEDAKSPSYDLKYLDTKSNKIFNSTLSKLQTNDRYLPTQKSQSIFEKHKEALFSLFVLSSILLLSFIAVKLLKNKEN